MMHKSVAGELQKEVDNTTDLLDDILSILALLEAGDWSEHCTKTELGGRLEREITRLISDAQNDLSPEHLPCDVVLVPGMRIHEGVRMNRPGFPGECFICELRLPDHRFRWKHNKLFLLLPEEYGPAFP
ncbi:hypothetical protein Q2V60_20985, partial [Escherichia coli]|nr:hypothetical protein [Escherichia coli]MDO2895432.1 hypothetical protein [Escherichia coli]